MNITEEQFNELPQLDRIECRQKLIRNKQEDDSFLWLILYVLIGIFTLQSYSLNLLTVYGAKFAIIISIGCILLWLFNLIGTSIRNKNILSQYFKPTPRKKGDKKC